MPVKLPGRCSSCGTEVFEITTGVAGGPGERREIIGHPLENAHRATFLLLGGSLMDLTFCESCLPHADDNLDQLWANVIESWLAEGAIPANDLDAALHDNFILGKLYSVPWKALADDIIGVSGG
jgi:hypothetical protein